MPRSLLLLIVAVVASAMLVVELRHRNRMAFVELQSMQSQRDALNTETGQLLLEEGAWAEHRRVEGLARERLAMSIPQSQQVVVVYADGQGRVSVAAGASPFTKTKGTR
jgi:cell division protein FtsL